MQDLSLVEIGIATKNRWEDLRRTLDRIAASGWGELRILLFDDASDCPCPYEVSEICAGAEITRFSEPAGYIVRRNQLARAMQSKYYLSLDDDSFPAAGSLESALKFAESCADLFCLSFPIFNPVTQTHQVFSLHDLPYKVRSFIGCGYLMNRNKFLDFDGYREELVHQGEEVEIAARVFGQGLHCYHFPGLQIHHTASSTGRDWHRMDYYGARNNVLWNDWFMPPQLKLIKQSRTFMSRAALFLKTGRLGHLQGQIAGFRDALKYQANRQQFPHALYKEWKSLPPC